MSTTIDEVVPVTIRILDKEYPIACTDEERHSLLDSARYLDQKMKQIKSSGKVVGSDRIAVMAALNITHDLLQCNANAGSSSNSGKIKSLQQKVESALTRYRQLEL